jgi:hypothetical protein
MGTVAGRNRGRQAKTANETASEASTQASARGACEAIAAALDAIEKVIGEKETRRLVQEARAAQRLQAPRALA